MRNLPAALLIALLAPGCGGSGDSNDTDSGVLVDGGMDAGGDVGTDAAVDVDAAVNVSPDATVDAPACTDTCDTLDRRECVGDTLYVCELNPNGCLERTATDCTESEMVCDERFARLECVPRGDCGNGVIDPGEVCDDGNFAREDGCSSVCEYEEGWFCRGQPSRCIEVVMTMDGELTEESPTWPRFDESCEALDSSQRRYAVHRFENTSDDLVAVDIAAQYAGFDGVLYLFTAEPDGSAVGCARGNDNYAWPGQIAIRGSLLFDVQVPAGEAVYIVVSGAGTQDMGAYWLSVREAQPLYFGELDDDDLTWVRPAVCAAGTTTVPYEIHTYQNTTDAAQPLTIVARPRESLWNFTHLHIYSSAPAAADWTDGCIQGTWGGGVQSRVDYTLAPDETLFIVVSAQQESERGEYVVRVDR